MSELEKLRDKNPPGGPRFPEYNYSKTRGDVFIVYAQSSAGVTLRIERHRKQLERSLKELAEFVAEHGISEPYQHFLESQGEQ